MNENLRTDSHTGEEPHRQARHGWMMMACCAPMLVIGVVLVATGVVRPAFLVSAILCTAMMALMMRGMNHGGSNQADHASTDHKSGDR